MDWTKAMQSIEFQFEPVKGPMPADEQAAAIHRNYKVLQRQVDADLADWNHSCPYDIADWLHVLSAEEMGAWQEIRSGGYMPLWPRLSVGELTISFGNPVLKIALLCSTEADDIDAGTQATASILRAADWILAEATGSQCTSLMEYPNDVKERTGEVSEEYRVRYQRETVDGVLQDLRNALGA